MFVQNQLNTLMPRRTTHCVRGNEPFVPDSEYFSFLVFGEKGWEREDFCAKCWECVKEEKEKAEGIVWRGKIPPKKTKVLSPDEKAMSLFRELSMAQTLDEQKLAFVLALYLERKKELHARGQMKNKICFEMPQSGEVFALDKIQLSKDEIDKVVSSLLGKLK